VSPEEVTRMLAEMLRSLLTMGAAFHEGNSAGPVGKWDGPVDDRVTGEGHYFEVTISGHTFLVTVSNATDLHHG